MAQTSRTRADLSLMWQNPRSFMRKLLVFQHSAREPLGVLDPMLRGAGFRIRYLNFSRQPDQKVDVSRYNGLVVLGGPMNVDQAAAYPHLLTEIAAIREALRQEVPVLCFNGTRDELCRRDLMERTLGKLSWQMHWLEGAGHSFRVKDLKEVEDVSRTWLAGLNAQAARFPARGG